MADNFSRRAFLRSMGIATVGVAGGSLLSACGGGSSSGGGNASIRFHARIGNQEDTLYDWAIPRFQEKHPNITVTKESFPGAEYPAKISTMKAGNSIGDAMWSALGQALIYFHYGQNVIQPLDDLIKAKNVDTSGWYKGCLDALSIDGKLLGLPFKAHPGVAAVYYNQTALDKVGIAAPTKEWTLDEQLAIAKETTIVEGDRVVQFGYAPNTTWKGFVTLLRAFGGELISEDLSKFQLNSDEGRAATQWLYDLHHVHKVAPRPDQITGTGADAPNQMWAGGSFALFQGGSSVANMASTIGDKFEWMVVPNAKGPAGIGGSDFEVDAYAITASSKNPEAAFDWINYLCGHECGVQLGIIGGTIGGRPDVYGDPEIVKTNYRPVFKELMDNAQTSRITGNWRQDEAEKAFVQLMQPLWAGDAQPDKAFIDDVTAQIQAIMDKPRA